MVALLAILKLSVLGWVGWVVIGACFASLVLLGLVFRSLEKVQPRPVEAVEVSHEDERVLTFTSSYVVPVGVALFSGGDVASLVATVALVLLLITIYVRAGLYHLNPTLAVLGFRLYRVKAASGAVTMLLSRAQHVPQRDVVECRYLGDNVAIQLKGRR